MKSVIDEITEHWSRFTPEESLAVLKNFLGGLEERDARRLLLLVQEGPQPLVAERMGLDRSGKLLKEIQKLHQRIENREFVEEGVAYDSELGKYRSYGDDSWSDQMDDLFAAATSFFRAGRFEGAAEAYRALFHIFDLNEDGWNFTHPDPAKALRTDLNEILRNLFVAIGRTSSEPITDALDDADQFQDYTKAPFALLDAWQERKELIAVLETALIDEAEMALEQEHPYPPYRFNFNTYRMDLLRELYRRLRDVSELEALCRRIGPGQGWPYEDLVARCREAGEWETALQWAEEGLRELPPGSASRTELRRSRGEALVHLDRPAEAIEDLAKLIETEPGIEVYLLLRQAARRVGVWETRFPEIRSRLDAFVRKGGISAYDSDRSANLLGFAWLAEGEIDAATAWGLDPAARAGIDSNNPARTVAAGLLRMGMAALKADPDEAIAEELAGAPDLVREHGEVLEAAASPALAEKFLESARLVYERLVETGIAGKARTQYAVAARYCRVLQSIRRLRKREAEFQAYYRALLEHYKRLPAFRDEARKAIEGPDYMFQEKKRR